MNLREMTEATTFYETFTSCKQVRGGLENTGQLQAFPRGCGERDFRQLCSFEPLERGRHRFPAAQRRFVHGPPVSVMRDAVAELAAQHSPPG